MSIKSKEDLLNKQAEVNEQIKSYTCRVLVCSGTGCIASGAQKIYEEMSVLCERIDGVTVEMNRTRIYFPFTDKCLLKTFPIYLLVICSFFRILPLR